MAFGDLFKTPEQIEREKLDKEKIRERARQELVIEEALSKVRFFPGNQDMFELFAGFPVKIIDFGNRDLGILLSKSGGDKDFVCSGSYDEKKRIVEAGVIAIICCQYSKTSYHNQTGGSDQSFRYGIPVAKYVDEKEEVQDQFPQPEFD